MKTLKDNIQNELQNKYGINVVSVEQSSLGAGGETYFINTDGERYVVKYFTDNSMDNSGNEAQLCSFLVEHGIPACEFIKNKKGEYISTDKNGKDYHVQKYIEGETKQYFEAPDWLMTESAALLGKIHRTLSEYKELPDGISPHFFEYCTVQNVLRSYEETLRHALEVGDTEIAEYIRSNMELLNRIEDIQVDTDNLTYANTHGDYMISQLILGENHINACIDWTVACRHPVIWEIIRFYTYASPECKNGEINIQRLVKYVETYMEYAPLSFVDLQNMGRFYFKFCSVLNFFGQFYESKTTNRGIFLEQAILASKLMRWFELHVTELEDELVKLENKF